MKSENIPICHAFWESFEDDEDMCHICYPGGNIIDLGRYDIYRIFTWKIIEGVHYPINKRCVFHSKSKDRAIREWYRLRRKFECPN